MITEDGHTHRTTAFEIAFTHTDSMIMKNTIIHEKLKYGRVFEGYSQKEN